MKKKFYSYHLIKRLVRGCP